MNRHQGRLAWSFAMSAICSLAMSSTTFAAEAEVVPGEYIVKIRPEYKTKNLNILSNTLDAQVSEKISDHGFYLVKKSMIETEKSVINSMATNPAVEYIEPNYVYKINRLPNDPEIAKLWGLQNSGQADSAGKVGIAGIDVGAEQAWEIQTGSRDVVVAVIDTGVDYNHPDLKENMWTNDAELNGQAGVDDDGNGYIDDIYGYDFGNTDADPVDDHGHGSHCAGTIGAKGDDGKGIVGVAWNVRIMALKFLTASGSGSTVGAIKSIDYATKMGAHIMSNSWGGGGASQALQEAIERSHQAGALFVAAAGNDGSNNDTRPTYPANYDVPNVLTVAAIDNNGIPASFTNYGKRTVHVAAPGVKIYSSITNGGYDSWSGTSMATPHVSGIAALVLSNENNLTNLEIKERIMRTVRPLASLKTKVTSGGMANAYLALTNTQAPPDPNDPALWPTQPVAAASAHPYKDKTNTTFEVNVAGAKEFSLFLDKFETEANYDVVKVYNRAGKLIQSLSGNQTGNWTALIDGDYAKLVFTSDDSVGGYGFDITKAAYR